MSGVKWDQAFEISARLQAALARVDHKESMDKQDFIAPETLSLPPKKRLPLNVRAGINLDLEYLRSKQTDYNDIYTDPKHFSLLKWLESNEKHCNRTTKRRKSLRKKKTSVPADKVESSTAPHKKESRITGATVNGSSVHKDSDDESDFIGFPDDGGHLCINQTLKFHDSDNDSDVSGFIGFSDDGSDLDGFPGFPDDGWNFCSLKVIEKD
ncbi:uncharacterized protein [Anabrus simplex]|uniref:uncharacterized protein n=1 Tax=Anabrus simplex TaxID=316456 RepID=UPI0035A38AA1